MGKVISLKIAPAYFYHFEVCYVQISQAHPAGKYVTASFKTYKEANEFYKGLDNSLDYALKWMFVYDDSRFPIELSRKSGSKNFTHKLRIIK